MPEQQTPSDSQSVDYVQHFDPREYLRQYYSLPQLAHDDALLFQHFSKWLKEQNRTFEKVLDVGCGPTIHNTFAIAPYANAIDLADYLPANLAEAKKWLDCHEEAHDWDPLFRGVLECQGVPATLLEERKALYRSKVRHLKKCDLRMPNPTGDEDTYDLVTTFFCPECVSVDRADWELYLDRILSKVRKGGAVYMAAVCECVRYQVLGTWFPSVSIAAHDLLQVLSSRGFTAGGGR